MYDIIYVNVYCFYIYLISIFFMSDIISIIAELLYSTCAFFIFFYAMFLRYKFKCYSNKEIVKKMLLSTFLFIIFVILLSITVFICIRYLYEK